MSVNGYSISKGKTNFNINLTSTQSNRTGALYDSFYPVDLRGHLDVSDFSKEYNVYLTFESESTSLGGINTAILYLIHLELGGNQTNSYVFAEQKTPHFIAFKSVYRLVTGGTSFIRFDTKRTDNSPIRVKGLYNLDKIGFNLFNANGQATSNSGQNYQVVLSFEEVEPYRPQAELLVMRKPPVAFNIYLNNNTSNPNAILLNNSRANVKFPVDLSTLVNPDDYSKSYKVYISGQTGTGTSSIAIGPAYFIDIKIGNNFINGENNFRTLNPRFLFASEVNDGNGQFYVNLKNNNNPPIILKSLYGVDFIQITIYSTNGTILSIFLNTIFILRFEEITD